MTLRCLIKRLGLFLRELALYAQEKLMWRRRAGRGVGTAGGHERGSWAPRSRGLKKGIAFFLLITIQF